MADFDCHIGDYVYVSVGSHLCGMVTVEDESWIDSGAIITNNLCICHGCMIGVGVVVIKNIRMIYERT